MGAIRPSVALLLCLFLLGVSGRALSAGTALPGPKDRCPVCGMFVAPYPEWGARIDFKDGTREFFDGPKDLFVFYFDLAKYRSGATAEDIAALFVTEYYSTQLVDVRTVFLVSGSDVMGPMGYELVPVAGKENAESFLRDHGGKKILQFNGVELVEIPGGK